MVRQSRSEFRISDWIRDDVNRALHLMLIHAELDNFDQRGQGDPAHPLTPAAQIAAQAKAKQRKHFGESAAFTGENHAETQVDNADSQVDRGIGSRLPLFTYIRKEAAPGGGSFR